MMHFTAIPFSGSMLVETSHKNRRQSDAQPGQHTNYTRTPPLKIVKQGPTNFKLPVTRQAVCCCSLLAAASDFESLRKPCTGVPAISIACATERTTLTSLLPESRALQVCARASCCEVFGSDTGFKLARSGVAWICGVKAFVQKMTMSNTGRLTSICKLRRV